VLTSKELLNRIDEVVERSYLDFVFDLLGTDFFTEEQKIQVESLGLIIGRRPMIELLYILARQRNSPGYKKDATLNRLLSEVIETGALPIINDESQYTVDHAKARLNEAIEVTKQKLKTTVKQEVLKVNAEYKEERTLTGVGNVITTGERITQKTDQLIGAVGTAVLAGGVIALFNKEFTTTITATINSAMVDQVRTDGLLAGLVPGETKVWKEVINDNRLSPECRRLHTNPDGSPRIYNLSELVANGSNIGKPKSAWKAVVSGTHPGCRCVLRPATPKMLERNK
jgi:hypothetical protein